MNLEVVTPFGAKVDEADVAEIVASGELGELGVRPGHIPLITSLVPGRLVVEKSGETKSYAADTGYLQVHGDTVRVITETLLAPEEIDVERAQKAFDRAAAALADPAQLKAQERRSFERKLARAQTRLAVAKLA